MRTWHLQRRRGAPGPTRQLSIWRSARQPRRPTEPLSSPNEDGIGALSMKMELGLRCQVSQVRMKMGLRCFVQSDTLSEKPPLASVAGAPATTPVIIQCCFMRVFFTVKQKAGANPAFSVGKLQRMCNQMRTETVLRPCRPDRGAHRHLPVGRVQLERRLVRGITQTVDGARVGKMSEPDGTCSGQYTFLCCCVLNGPLETGVN